MILVISGGRQTFLRVCLFPAEKEGGQNKTGEKTCFLTKMNQIWPFIKFLHFVFFSHKTKKQLSQTLLKSF